jgi:hypothetical protein
MKVDDKVRESANALLDTFQKRTAELHDALVPQWNARADALKTIVSLSSASIVLSVTFSSSLRQINAGSAWRYLIIASFALFVVALITGFLALWFGAAVYQMQSLVLDKRTTMTNILMTAGSAEEIEKSFERILREALQPIFIRDNRITTLYVVSGLCFCVAILSLAIIGAVRLF